MAPPTKSAAKPKAAAPSDPVPLGTSFAPWMEKAWSQTKVRAIPADSFIKDLRFSLQMEEKMRTLEGQLGSMQLEMDRPAGPGANLRFVDKVGKKERPAIRPLHNPIPGLVAGMERDSLIEKNKDIEKYFAGLKADPEFNSGKEGSVEHTHLRTEWDAKVTAWCAAFVNWCLKEVGAPYLNYATAKSWLKFGTEVSAPVYGCVTIIKPQSSTGGGTGHVAFYVRHKGNKVVLLGGNQSRRVKESDFKETDVLGYRWPTNMDHYLAVGGQTLLLGLKDAFSQALGPTK